MSSPRTSSLLALGVFLAYSSSHSLALELGSCALIQIQQEPAENTDELLISVHETVLNDASEDSNTSPTQSQTDLASFSFDSSNSGIGSSFSNSSFSLPTEASSSEDTGLLDFSADGSGY